MVALAKPSLAEPVMASTNSGRSIKTGVAYEREFERYLVRLFLEQNPAVTAAFLDSEKAAALPAENLLVACLALPAKESAPRVAKLLGGLDRAPNDEEILRLAEAPDDPAVRQALVALVGKAEGLQALLRQQTRFDSRALAPLVVDTAKNLLPTDSALALKLIVAFDLKELEPSVAALPVDVAVLTTLRQLGSTRFALFEPVVKSGDAAQRDAALAALVSTPDRLLGLWPEMNAAQRRTALAGMASQTVSAAVLVAAVEDGRIAKEELDGSLVERLQAVLKDDVGLKTLLESMGGFFASVLSLDGTDAAWIDSRLSLAGAFTVESWIKLAPGMGNKDSLLSGPEQLDINFYDGKLRVWVGGGLHDVVVASKAITPDAWTHVAVTRDVAGNFQLYLNGEPNAAGTVADPRPYTDLAVGRSNVALGTNGQFAEYRVWNTCRSAGEIRAAFDRTGLSATTTLATGALASLVYYRPMGGEWDAAQAGARTVRTMDFPDLITPDAAVALDEKFSHYRALAEAPGGDAVRGQVLGAMCMGCHLVKGQGGQIGPNLSAAGAMGTESLLRNILTPNAAMEPGYRVFRAELTDGSLREGFLASQDETAVVMRVPGSEDQRIPRDQIRRGSFTKRSLMPEGLELSFTPEQWTDLFAWLKSLR